MVNKNISHHRRNGIFYTPSSLAEYLAKPLLDSPNNKIFDPAYGNGALLTAAVNILRQRYQENDPGAQLFGCDREPGEINSNYLKDDNLSQCDFFQYPTTHKFNTILMNPPYVRHHLIEGKDREYYNRRASTELKIKGTSDLWAFFLLKATEHLEKTGDMGAILPWSFLQADYASRVREWLIDKFQEIKVMAVGAEYFPGAKERILLLWLKGFGQKTTSLKIAFARKIQNQPEYMEISPKTWKAQRVVVSENHDMEGMIERYISQYNFIRFSSIANVRIGVVTGADKFFIVPREKARALNFSTKRMLPIISTAKEFFGLELNGRKPEKRLLLFSKEQTHNELSYIREGERLGLHLRAHSRLRSPWFAVKVGELPDAFFPYRMASIPYLMLNSRYQCTNSVHRVYFNNLTENEKRWAQVSLLALPGQLALESYSKTYGRGVLKIEPSALKNAIVFIDDDSSVNAIYPALSSLITSGQKNKAMETATEFLNKKLGISDIYTKNASNALAELRKRRFLSKSQI